MSERTPNMLGTQENSLNTGVSSVTRKIERPYLIARVAEFKDKIAIDEWPPCSIHGKSVSIHEVGSAAPFGPPGFAVIFTGCCDAALDRFFEFMDTRLGLRASCMIP